MHALLDDAAYAPLPEVPAAPALPVEHPLEFHGDAREYFRIWIVNVALSLVTLGIYSAWAKVRTQRYFYGNTRLAGVPFEYSAQPLPILRGRLVAAALFGAYLLTAQFAPVWNAVVLGVILLLTPVIIVSGLRFRARYSAWRGMSFRFHGRMGTAIRRFLIMPWLSLFTLMLLYPYVKQRQQDFVVGNHRFGREPFALAPQFGLFYAVYFVTACAVGGWITILFVGMLIPGSAAEGAEPDPVAVYAFVALFYAGFFGILAGLRTALTNLMWNHATLGPHRFRSTLSEARVVWIFLSNAAAIVASLGLLVPWAKVRLARYRAAHWVLIADGDLDAFVADVRHEESAAGAEVGEAFDVDLSI